MPDDNAPEHTASAGGEQATGANSSQQPEEPATAVQATASGSEPQAASIGILPADHWAQVSQVVAANDSVVIIGTDSRWLINHRPFRPIPQMITTLSRHWGAMLLLQPHP